MLNASQAFRILRMTIPEVRAVSTEIEVNHFSCHLAIALQYTAVPVRDAVTGYNETKPIRITPTLNSVAGDCEAQTIKGQEIGGMTAAVSRQM